MLKPKSYRTAQSRLEIFAQQPFSSWISLLPLPWGRQSQRMSWSLWVNYLENIRHALRIRADPSSPQQPSRCFEHAGSILLKHNGALKMSEIKKKTLFLQKSSWRLLLPGHSWEGLHELWKSSEVGSLIRRGLLQSGGDTVYAGRVHVSTA